MLQIPDLQGFALSLSPIGSIDISDVCFLLECEINAQQLWVCVWWPNVTDIKNWWMQSFYDYDHQLNLDFCCQKHVHGNHYHHHTGTFTSAGNDWNITERDRQGCGLPFHDRCAHYCTFVYRMRSNTPIQWPAVCYALAFNYIKPQFL